jgi:protein-tyrosine phosphatase
VPSEALRRLAHRVSTRIYGPKRHVRGMTWVSGDRRLAIGAIPVGREIDALPDAGVTHLIVCRAPLQTVLSQDLWSARRVLGPDHVAHAPMWDDGKPKDPALWAPAALFGARALEDDPGARVLVHCQQGRRRSVMVAYAILRLRGLSPDEASEAVLEARPFGTLVPAYRASVERWLAAGGGAAPPGT